MTNRDSSSEEFKFGVTFWSLAKSAFGLLTLRECRIAAGLVVLVLVVGGLGMIALAMVMPVVKGFTETSLLDSTGQMAGLIKSILKGAPRRAIHMV